MVEVHKRRAEADLVKLQQAELQEAELQHADGNSKARLRAKQRSQRAKLREDMRAMDQSLHKLLVEDEPDDQVAADAGNIDLEAGGSGISTGYGTGRNPTSWVHPCTGRIDQMPSAIPHSRT